MNSSTTAPSPPYGTTIRLANAYEAARRHAVSPTYQALKSDRDPLEQKNFKHFERAAALMISCGCRSEEEWIRAQFIGASITTYPYPSNLYSERAAQKYLELADAATVPGAIKVQQDWLTLFTFKSPHLTVTDVVLNPAYAFESWFRVYYAKQVTPAQAAEASKDLQRSTALRNSIVAAGYNLAALETKIAQIIKQGV